MGTALVRFNPPRIIVHPLPARRRRYHRVHRQPRKWEPGRQIAWAEIPDLIRRKHPFYFWYTPRYASGKPIHASVVAHWSCDTVWHLLLTDRLRVARIRQEYIDWLRVQIMRDDLHPVRRRELRIELIGEVK
jgi:hypothetical protein